jgi:CheY-like chemotaxis protein
MDSIAAFALISVVMLGIGGFLGYFIVQRRGASFKTSLTLAKIMELKIELSDSDRSAAVSQIGKAAEARGRQAPRAASVELPEKAQLKQALWVDDFPQNNVHEMAALRAVGVFVTQVTRSDVALKLLTEVEFDVVITDLMRDGDRVAGIEFTKQVRQMGVSTAIIVYTGHVDDREGDALTAGASKVVDEPLSLIKAVRGTAH